MLTVLLILFPFISALIVFFTKGRLARNLALTFSVFEFIIALVAFLLFTHNPNLSILCFNHTWVQSLGISFSVSINGLSLLMILLTTFLWRDALPACVGRTRGEYSGYHPGRRCNVHH